MQGHYHKISITTLLVLLVFLPACSMAPKYQRPDLPVPEKFTESTEGQSSDLGWREFFTQPALQEIIELALANNRDLRISTLHIAEARSLYDVQFAARLPSLNIGAGFARGRSVDVPGFPHSPVGDAYSASAGVSSFEIDLWGRVKSLSDAALSEYLATEEAKKSVEISLISNVASLYMAERSLAAQEVLTMNTLKTREETREITQKRFNAGMATAIEVSSNEMLVESARAALAAIQRERSHVTNALKLLVGSQGYEMPQDAPALEEFNFALISSGIPSDLLVRRPDIRMSEKRLEAANARIGAARAAFFPNISLTTNIGGVSNELNTLFSGPASIWSFAPSLVMPIFNGGRNIANLNISEVRKEIAVAEYEKSIQTAFMEVMDALATRELVEKQISAQQKVCNADRERFNLVSLRYDRGLANYLELLDVQRSLFESERQLIALKAVRIDNSIVLYKVLGGGWQEQKDIAK